MNDENKIIGDQEHGKIEELLKKAGKDRVVNEVVEGARKPKVSSLGPIIAAKPIEKIREPWKEAKVRAVAYHPDSRHIVTGNDKGEVRLFELDEKKGLILHKIAKASDSGVYGLSYGMDGRFLAAAGADKMLRTFDTGLGFLDNKLSLHQEHGDFVYGVDFSPDNKHIVTTCNDGYVRIFEFKCIDVKEIGKQEYNAWGIAFAPNGMHLVAGAGKKIRFLEFDKNEIFNSTALKPFDIGKPIYGVDFSPDGIHVAVGSDDGVGIYRFLDDYDALQVPHPEPVCGVAFSPDGKNLATVCNDCYLRIFELKRK